jgi:hypothetical protein
MLKAGGPNGRSCECAAVGNAPWRSTLETVDRGAVFTLGVNLANLPLAILANLPPGHALIRAYLRDAPRIWYDAHFDSSPLWEDVEINMDMFN